MKDRRQLMNILYRTVLFDLRIESASVSRISALMPDFAKMTNQARR